MVVTGVEDGLVRFHDPHGHPYATLPTDDFIAAWRADSIGYATEPFTARAGFQRVRDVDEATALRRALPMAVRWLAGEMDLPVPPGSLGGAAALERLAELIETGLEPWQHGHLGYFAIRVGARRLADAAACLAFIGENKAAVIADEQARLVGALQYPLVAATASQWHGCCGGWRRRMNSFGPACRAVNARRPAFSMQASPRPATRAARQGSFTPARLLGGAPTTGVVAHTRGPALHSARAAGTGRAQAGLRQNRSHLLAAGPWRPRAQLERATYCLGGTTAPALCRPATRHVTSERNSSRQLLPERPSLGACFTAGGGSIFEDGSDLVDWLSLSPRSVPLLAGLPSSHRVVDPSARHCERVAETAPNLAVRAYLGTSHCRRMRARRDPWATLETPLRLGGALGDGGWRRDRGIVRRYSGSLERTRELQADATFTAAEWLSSGSPPIRAK